MDSSYKFPQGSDYLALRSQAAMGIESSTSGYHLPASDLTTSDDPTTSTTISNPPNSARHYISSSQSHTPELIDSYNQYALPSDNSDMEALAFNPDQASKQRALMDSAFRGIGSEISANYVNNLGILNAESYSDMPLRTFDTGNQASQQELPMGYVHESREDIEEPDTRSRRSKRPRVEAQKSDDDEESRKKSRGRPRVDTKDETAADVSQYPL